MKAMTVSLAIAFLVAAMLMLTSRAVSAWGLPEGFNPETGEIEKPMDARDIHKTSTLFGTAVWNERGERLGTVEEILFSDDGRIEYVVLARDTGIEGAERLVPVPWDEVDAEIRDDRLIVSLDKAAFENAPSFARNDWQRFDDPEWNRRLRGYY